VCMYVVFAFLLCDSSFLTIVTSKNNLFTDTWKKLSAFY
jgi:hypothetical protein